MMKNSQSSSGNAWAWATVAIVFIVFYFSREGRRPDSLDGQRDASVPGHSVHVSPTQASERDRRDRIANELRAKAAHLRDEAAAKLHSEAGQVPEQVARYRTLARSMDWLNRSMETVGEKLRDVSSRIENHETDEEVEKAVKRALMEAFAETQSSDDESTSVTVATVGSLTTAGAEAASVASTAGEIESSSSFAFTAGETESTGSVPPAADISSVAPVPPVPPVPPTEEVVIAESTLTEGLRVPELSGSVSKVIIVSGDQPILGEGVPDWIRQPVTEGKRIVIPIESSMHSTLEECREDLDSKLVPEVKRMLTEHVLQRVSADEIPELTASFIREKLVRREGEFDNYQERPSGNFHQLWVRMEADEKEIEQIRDWERGVVTQDRAKQLGGAAGAVLVTLALFSGAVGWFANREQKRTKKSPVE